MFYNPNLLLILSSSSYFCSSFYGYLRRNELYRMDLVNALATTSYWIDPDDIFKHKMNIFVWSFTSMGFFVHGYKTLPPYWRTIVYLNLGGMLSFLNMSYVLRTLNFKRWYYFHFIFHMFMFANKMIIYSF
tara:strand:- start:2797 stop:3189 length:393 start_codon:yes stop_codon:yes gene_type:complete